MNNTPTAARRIVWLLDVDGVLNADTPPWGDVGFKAGRIAVDSISYRFTWNTKLIDEIRAVHDGGGVAIRWATSWCPYARKVERKLGLPEFGRAFTVGYEGDRLKQVKLVAARLALAAGNDLIWTDDDAFDGTGEQLFTDVVDVSGRVLLIKPQEQLGLTPTHMADIRAFIAARKAAKAGER